MQTKYAVHLAACVAIITFAIALALPSFIDVPLLWYRPTEHAWSYQVHPSGGIAMDFFGRCLLASVSSSVTATLAYSVARRTRRNPSRRAVGTAAVWAIGILAIAIAFFTW